MESQLSSNTAKTTFFDPFNSIRDVVTRFNGYS